jgi:hypothetical protein
MNMEHWWIGTDGGKLNYLEKTKYYFFYYKSHMGWPVIECGSVWWEAGHSPLDPWHSPWYHLQFC